MPYITQHPEVVMPAQNANSWAIDTIIVTLLDQMGALPGVRLGIAAELVEADGSRHLVTRSDVALPAEVLTAAMAAPVPTGAANLYEAMRTGFYQAAQAAGLIPANATYQTPPAES